MAEAAAPHLTGPEQGRWLARLDADQANLRRAAEHAADDADGTAQALRFGVALHRYWMARSRPEEPIRLLGPVLDRPEARADPQLFTAALVAAASGRGGPDITAALQRGEQAVAFARRLGDERLLINSLASLCGNHYFAGEAEQGLPLGQEAVERARRLGDDVLLGASLMGCLLPLDLIDPARAEPLFTEAIACTQRSGDQLIASVLRNNASMHALRAGDLPAARAHLEQAAQAARAIGEESSTVLINLGSVLRQEGDPDGAGSMFEAGLRIARRNGDRSDLGLRLPRPGLPGHRPRRLAAGPGCCTAPRRPFSTGSANPGRNPKRATAARASASCAPAWAMSRLTGPTPKEWRSVSTRPSTWHSEEPTQPEPS